MKETFQRGYLLLVTLLFLLVSNSVIILLLNQSGLELLVVDHFYKGLMESNGFEVLENVGGLL